MKTVIVPISYIMAKITNASMLGENRFQVLTVNKSVVPLWLKQSENIISNNLNICQNMTMCYILSHKDFYFPRHIFCVDL